MPFLIADSAARCRAIKFFFISGTLKWTWRQKFIYMLTLLPKGLQTKLLKFFCLKVFSICHRCQRHQWQTLSCEYLRKFSKKFETALKVYSEAWGKMIQEKNQKQKISWHCPFKYFFNCRSCREMSPCSRRRAARTGTATSGPRSTVPPSSPPCSRSVTGRSSRTTTSRPVGSTCASVRAHSAIARYKIDSLHRITNLWNGTQISDFFLPLNHLTFFC